MQNMANIQQKYYRMKEQSTIFQMNSNLCMMCKQEVDGPLQFGEKIHFRDITAHHFCLLLSGRLPQTGSDDEGIFGFMPQDIKKEILRSKKQRCIYCHQNGANISCCHKKCKKAFHLPCAVQQDCRFQFTGRFQSFCDEHHQIEKPFKCHEPTDLCVICFEQMGKYNVIQSIQPVCCKNNSWFHKSCVQKHADAAGHFHLKCPLCNDSELFRKNIARRGVFIPHRDAKWEKKAESAFYGFDQHDIRPVECVAESCKSRQGRMNYINKKGEYLLVVCQCCGSKGVHKCCLKRKSEFLCDDCDFKPISKKQKLTKGRHTSVSIHNDIDMNNNVKMSLNDVDLQKSNEKLSSTPKTSGRFVEFQFKVIVPNLTEKEVLELIGKKRKLNEI